MGATSRLKAWTSAAFPALEGMALMMFSTPFNSDGCIDLVIGFLGQEAP